MEQIGSRELKQKASEVLRRVREGGETISITYRGRIVARLVPVNKKTEKAETLGVWADMDEVAAEIGARWPVGVTAAKAVREQRREL
ncbi:MAG: type II toxin-antitoxin system prevent-host-death family antitoxin [Chloroflexi bacterium]|nr:type II toxin-antitoxin system prevent-host-death family antitoxin [Chloroflexota bacterium]